MGKYISVSFEKKLLHEVDKFVKKSPRYSNRADFCRQAIRDKMELIERGLINR